VIKDGDLRLLVIDDEPLARQRIAALVRRVEGVTVVAEAGNVEEGVAQVGALRPDVILLDVQLSRATGFDLLQRLDPATRPKIIFATAYDRFAAQGFEVAAVDYILKPVALDRLKVALARAREAKELKQAKIQHDALARELAAKHDTGRTKTVYAQEFWVLHRGEHRRVPVDTIEWIEAQRDYVKLDAGRSQYLLRAPISDIEARLDPAVFVRVRRSVIIRRAQVAAIKRGRYGSLSITLYNGVALRVGRSYAASVRALSATIS